MSLTCSSLELRLNNVEPLIASSSVVSYKCLKVVGKLLRIYSTRYETACSPFEPEQYFILSRHPHFNDQLLRRTQDDDLRRDPLNTNGKS